MADPKLVIRIAANLDEFRRVLEQAQAEIVTTKGRLEQMARSFSGESIIRDANAMVAAIDRIGGVSKLTAAEQGRVNAVVTEALAKYRALGLEAPPALQQLAAATQHASTSSSVLVGTLKQVGGVLLGGLGVASAALAIKRAVIDTVAWAGSLGELASKAGISTSMLQQLSHVARQTAVDEQTVVTAVGRLMARIGTGSRETEAALSALGVSMAQLKTLSPDETLRVIFERLRGLPSVTQQAALAVGLFGRSGIELLPLVQQFEQLRGGAVVVSESAIKAADQMGDAWQRLSSRMQASLATVLGPVLRAILEAPNLLARAFFGSLEGIATALEKLSRTFGGSGEKARQWAQWAHDARTASQDFTRAAEDQAAKTRQLGAVSDETLEALQRQRAEMERSAQKVRELAERLSGAGLAGQVRQLEAAWRLLTPAQRENADVVRRMGDEVRKLHEQGAALTPTLQALLPPLQAQTLAWTDLASLGFVPVLNRGQALRNVLNGLTEEGLLASRSLSGLSVTVPELSSVTATATATTAGLRAALRQVRAEAEASSSWAQRFREAFGGVGETISQFIQQAFLGGGGLGGAAKALISRVGSAIGAAVGAIFGPLGAQIGQALGSLLGPLASAIGSLFRKPEWKKVVADVGRDLGLTLSENLAKAIAEDSKRLGDRVAATLLHLREIITEAGGVAAFGFERAVAKARDLFVMIETGKLSAREAGKAFGEVFGELVPLAIDRTTGLAARSFTELIELARRFGLASTEAVQRFVADQAETAKAGFEAFLKNARLSSQEAALAVSGAVAATFAALVQGGRSMSQALADMQPLFTQLDERLRQAGLTGSEAFGQLRDLARLSADEVAGPALASVDGLRQGLAALANVGLLDAEMFSGLARQVGDTFATLIAQGYDGNQVMLLMQPTLQTLWELQRRFGWQVDETTQALLDQAAQAGLVGDQHREAMDRVASALERVAGLLERLVGGTQQFGAALATIPREIEVRGHVIWDDWSQGQIPVPAAAVAMQHGGIVTRPTLALIGERGPEAVVPLSRLSAGAASGGTVVLEIDRRIIAEIAVPAIPEVVRRYRLA